MDIRKIKKIIELIEESGVTEIEIKEGEECVRISRLQGATPTPATAPMFMPPPGQPSIIETEKAADSGESIRAPMVGTFYRAPNPQSKPFVEEGQSICVGDTLCIIEAMKMMNQIEADRAGTIRKVLVENAQAVEFDQPLFLID